MRFRAGFRAGILLAAAGIALVPELARARRSWTLRCAVVGDSMRPLLDPGDWLLVDPEAYRAHPPRPSDLVAVPDPRDPSRWLVKRVHAVTPEGRLDLRGDDAIHSTDSRTFGPVDAGSVIGRPWARYWPPGRIGLIR